MRARRINITTTASSDGSLPLSCYDSGHVSCITAGAAYRVRGIDLGVGGKITDKWSVFGGLVLMQSAVTKSLVPPADPLLYRTNVGLPLANIAQSIVQPAQQISAHRRLGAWRTGGVSFPDLRRHLACRQPGHVDPELLALRRIRGSEDQQELDRSSCSSTTSSTSSITTRLYQSAAPFVSGSARPRRILVISARF